MHNKGRFYFWLFTAAVAVAGIFSVCSLAVRGISIFEALIPNVHIADGSGSNLLSLGSDSNRIRRRIPSFSKSVAVLHIDGVIEDENKTYSQEWITSTIESLVEDSSNTAILLVIDSPGGGVYQSDEVYEKLCSYKAKTGRPVFAYLGSMAASGGYYIACAADTIFANRNTLTGSIGVIFGQSIDMTGLFDKIGIKVQTIHSGTNKTMLNPDTPLTAEQREIMQSIADECYDQFVGIVSESRKLSASDVRRLADGRVYTAKQALSHTLIDDICTYEEAEDTIRTDYNLSESEFVDMWYEPKLGWESLFSVAKTFIAPSEAIIPDVLSKQLDQYHLYPSYTLPGF